MKLIIHKINQTDDSEDSSNDENFSEGQQGQIIDFENLSTADAVLLARILTQLQDEHVLIKKDETYEYQDENKEIFEVSTTHHILTKVCSYEDGAKHFEVIAEEELGHGTNGDVYLLIGRINIVDNKAVFIIKNQQIIKIGVLSESQTPFSNEYTAAPVHVDAKKPILNEDADEIYLISNFFHGKTVSDMVRTTLLTVQTKSILTSNLCMAMFIQCHCQNILHVDTHVGNIIADEQSNKVNFIDYDLSLRVPDISKQYRSPFKIFIESETRFVDVDRNFDFKKLSRALLEIWCNGYVDPDHDITTLKAKLNHEINLLPEEKELIIETINLLKSSKSPTNLLKVAILNFEKVRLALFLRECPEKLRADCMNAHSLAMQIKTALLDQNENANLYIILMTLLQKAINSLSDEPVVLKFFIEVLNFQTLVGISTKEVLIKKVATMDEELKQNSQEIQRLNDTITSEHPKLIGLSQRCTRVLQQSSALFAPKADKADTTYDGMSAFNAKLFRHIDKISKRLAQSVTLKPKRKLNVEEPGPLSKKSNTVQ